MTIPWLMNCEHMPDGWCLECVIELRGNTIEKCAIVCDAAIQVWRGDMKDPDKFVAIEELSIAAEKIRALKL